MQEHCLHALNESDMIDKMPDGWRPVQSARENSRPRPSWPRRYRMSSRRCVTKLRRWQTREAKAEVSVPPLETTTAAIADATARPTSFAVLDPVVHVVHRQATLQVDAESAATEGNATKVAALKARISRFSASAIPRCRRPTSTTPPRSWPRARRLVRDGANLYDKAVQVWESPRGVRRVINSPRTGRRPRSSTKTKVG